MPSPHLTGPPPSPGYEFIRELGTNGCRVYLARHSPTGTLVGLKLCRRDVPFHFPDQYAAWARLDHPNILRLLEFGEFEDYFYLAWEYVEGQSLADRLLQGPLPEAQVARIAYGICSALRYARDQGMAVERVRAEAVLLDRENVPRLCDFSPVTRLPPQTATSASLYRRPEQLQLKNIDAVTDVYWVGAIMYEMLTSAPPFQEAVGSDGVLHLLLMEPKSPRQVNPKVGRALGAICTTCLAKRADARYSSLRELSDRLNRLLR
jgi:eukaryotic-like serine/threonine-protein kinase